MAQVQTAAKENKPSNGGSASVSSYAQQVADLVNDERSSAGLSSLTMNAELCKVAQAKAEDMRDNNYFSHTSPTYGSPFEMMKQFGISYSAAGENIAKGQKKSGKCYDSLDELAGSQSKHIKQLIRTDRRGLLHRCKRQYLLGADVYKIRVSNK